MRLAALLLAVALAACGGGGGSSPSVSLPTTPRTTPLYACYYAGKWETIGAYADHANCVEPGSWEDRHQGMALATNAGRVPAILMLPQGTCMLPLDQVESETTAFLARLDNGGNLRNILAIRPGDEWTIPDATAKACIVAIHAAMAKFPGTIGKPLTIYYPCSSSNRPGIEFIDWPGCDVYDWDWPRIFRVYEGYETPGESSRGVAMIAGGSDPWRQDPTPMVDYALHNDEVKLVQGFCYDECGSIPLDQSISKNGMLPVFKIAFGRVH